MANLASITFSIPFFPDGTSTTWVIKFNNVPLWVNYPNNTLLQPSGPVLVADGGLANATSVQGLTTNVPGLTATAVVNAAGNNMTVTFNHAPTVPGILSGTLLY